MPKFSRAFSARNLSFALALACLWLASSAATSRADDVPADAIVADLPFMNVPGSQRIHLDLAAPGDPPLPVLLDTGFMYPLASPVTIRKIGGRPIKESPVGTVRDSALGVPITILTSEIDGTDAISDPWVRFGGSPLRPYILELDFEKRRVRFIDREKFSLATIPPSENSAIVPIRHMGFRPFMMVQVNDRDTFVAIDTTVTLPITIGPRELAKAAVHPKTLPVLRERGEHASTTRLFETDKVRVGPFDFGVVPVFVSPVGTQDELGLSGNAIGLDVLAQFKVRFDLEGREMWLERRPSVPLTFGGVSYSHTRASGLFLSPIGTRWFVLGVLPGSPAEQAGFLPGDRLEREGSEFTDARVVQEAVRNQQPLRVQRGEGEELQKLMLP